MSIILSFILDTPWYLTAIYGTLGATLLVLLAHEVSRIHSKAALSGLPGPTGLPIVGNLYQVKGKPAYEIYRQWAKTYGPVFKIQFGSMPVVVVNDNDAARELFINQHAAIMSRPVLYTFHKTVNYIPTAEKHESPFETFSIGTSPWDPSCKQKRRAAATALNMTAVRTYAPILEFETKEFIRELFEESNHGKNAVYLKPLIYHLSINMSLTLNYGTRLLTFDSPLFREIFEVEAAISKFRSTSENLADFFPFLRYNPFSGQSKYARDIGDRRKAVNYKLLDGLQKRIEEGTDRPCIIGNVLKDSQAKLSRKELLGVSMSIVAGADSNMPTLGWTIAYLIQNPEWQSRLYQALKEHILAQGDDLNDGPGYVTAEENAIPIFDAFVREILRFFPPLRTGIPRAAYKDTVFNGGHIPAGTEVLLNLWALNRDPAIFSDPETFDPYRWLDPANKANPRHYVYSFGLGARNCPASFLTYRILYLSLIRLLWAFHLEAEPGTDGPNCHPIHGSRSTVALGQPIDDYNAILRPRNVEALAEWLGEKPVEFGGLKSE